MAKCIYKQKTGKGESTYKFKCTWGGNLLIPNPYYELQVELEDLLHFIYLSPGECKGCKAKIPVSS